MNLEDLLNRIQPSQASTLTKSAADDSDDKKDEKKDEKSEFPFAKKDEDKKDEKKDDEKKDDGEEKKASVSPAASALVKEILEKVAASQVTKTPEEGTTQKENKDMNKQASEAGQALAQALLESLQKSASAGDTNTVDGVNPGSPASKAQADTMQVIAEDNAKIKPMPGMGGTVNQIYDAIVADAMAQGAASSDQVHTQGVSNVEGAAEEQATPGQVETEKVAAVNALMADGLDLFSAVDLVKAAHEELVKEQETFTKQAALNSLIERGLDFDTAVALIRKA